MKKTKIKVYKEDVDRVVLSVKEILMYLVDFGAILFEYGDKSRVYRRSIKEYWKWRDFDKTRFSKDLYRLKRDKFIKIYLEGKNKHIELTVKGKNKIKSYLIADLKIKIPQTWDQKWRIVIFDIPNEKKTARDILAKKLKNLGFLRLQKSVFVFPYDCKSEIDYLKEIYEIKSNVQYIIADRIDTEINLLKYFYDNAMIVNETVKP